MWGDYRLRLLWARYRQQGREANRCLSRFRDPAAHDAAVIVLGREVDRTLSSLVRVIISFGLSPAADSPTSRRTAPRMPPAPSAGGQPQLNPQQMAALHEYIRQKKATTGGEVTAATVTEWMRAQGLGGGGLAQPARVPTQGQPLPLDPSQQQQLLMAQRQHLVQLFFPVSEYRADRSADAATAALESTAARQPAATTGKRSGVPLLFLLY